MDKLKAHHCQYCFTDGHAWDGMTSFYHQDKDLKQIDWDMVKEKQWANTDDDFDRKRRKQAEILVHRKAPIETLEAIVVKGTETFNFAQEQVTLAGLAVPVHNRPNYYY
ncbi:MAG: DUF4433 domain-containing protein [Saprospirales bacterium]|nr:DUF4433 domain-containing protein [Saprospirales bacterium]